MLYYDIANNIHQIQDTLFFYQNYKVIEFRDLFEKLNSNSKKIKCQNQEIEKEFA